MSDKMNPLKLEHLLSIVLKELDQAGSIFGIPKHSFFDPKSYPELRLRRFGQLLETPFGVAAGPQTQLSQNIIASWLTGSRYIELKTIQTLDELEISKPCIDMEDQGFNCEWSQELKLHESFAEYLNAWVVIHILRHKLGHDNGTKELGCIFNMSCGYNLEGILRPNVQEFLRKMKSCPEELKQAIAVARTYYPEVDSLGISAQMTDNITLSTMHGCPPDEIEKIAMYLLEEQKLHTTVKLNPTLNGPKELRSIVNDTLGFHDVTIPDLAFEHDLKYPDGVRLITNLKKRAQELNLFFGLKLTNTLESVNNKDNFDKKNEMMYMSGRPLHALAINLAKKLQNEFKGELDISFSSGADAFNVMHVLACDLRPVTVSTDLLKPGGYERTMQYVSNTAKHMHDVGAKNLAQLVCKMAQDDMGGIIGRLKGLFSTPDLKVMRQSNLAKYLPRVLADSRYHRKAYPWNLIKTDRVLGKFDCIQAPCNDTCPTHQDIPGYMYLVANQRPQEALELIRQTNPFPNSTGVACDHICEDKCSRLNYDDTLKIRDIKRYAAMKEKEVSKISPKRSLEKSIAIVGAGPSGLSAAFYLAYEGFKVEVFEAKNIVGGMLTHALPNFRTSKGIVEKDIDRIRSLGVIMHEQSPVNSAKYAELKAKFDYVYLAIGAQKSKDLGVEGENVKNVMGHLEFLEQVKLGKLTSLPTHVVVIGGGNSAIDCVRTAKRLVPPGGVAMLVYRRTIAEMPANREEIEELLEENIKVLELTAPSKVLSAKGEVTALECVRMELGSPDASGRRSPQVVKGSEFNLEADFIVKAIGQDIDTSFIKEIVSISPKGTISQKDLKVQDRVFTGGDVSRGPASIIKAVADGKNAAFAIMKELGVDVPQFKKVKKAMTREEIKLLRRERLFGPALPKSCHHHRNDFSQVVKTFTDHEAKAEASRCLMCDELCDVCVTVCPNRANISYQISPVDYQLHNIAVNHGQAVKTQAYQFAIAQTNQTLNIGDFCNECGNCRAFCPSNGRPYADKPKLYITEAFFAPEKNNAYFIRGNSIEFRTNGQSWLLEDHGDHYSFSSPIANCTISKNSFDVQDIKPLADGEIDMCEVVGMSLIYHSMKKTNFLLM